MKTKLIVLGALMVSVAALADPTPIYDIQYTTNPSGDSPLEGQVVTIEGIVTATTYYGFWVADAAGPWNGVYVYSRDMGCDPRIGDELSVTGEVSEYYDLTEITDTSGGQPVICQTLSTGNPVDITTATTDELDQEQWEGVLVQVNSVTVTDVPPPPSNFGLWGIDDGSGEIQVDDETDYLYFPTLGDSLDALIGTVQYSFSEWKIQPRRTLDIVSDEHIPHYALFGDVVVMGEPNVVLEDHFVEIHGDMILSVEPSAPRDLEVIDVDGLIFPGLIDSHNHPVYNALDIIPFPVLFEERAEWQGHPMYGDFYDQYNFIRDYGGSSGSYEQGNNIWKLAMVRAMAAGTTMIQGRNCNSHYDDAFARLGIGINNVERFPSRSYSKTFPLTYDDWPYQAGLNHRRLIIHLCEGTNQNALDEFDDWDNLVGLDWRTVIIHGVPLGPTEWTQMVSADAHLIWSPKSNWVLYEATANIPQALAAGVNVALAPDWTESGERDILEEMHFARETDDLLWGGVLTDEWFARAMITNAARACGMEDRLGRVEAGLQADLMVIPGDPADPFAALTSAHAWDVKLTVVSGRPRYGDPEVMDQCSFVTDTEDIGLCGVTKRLKLAETCHAIDESERTFAELLTTLEDAFALAPPLCDFMGIDPCNGLTPTATPTPDNSTPTPSPIPTETQPPTVTPEPTAAPTTGVTLSMPADFFRTGDPCSLSVRLINMEAHRLEVPVVVMLDAFGEYYFWPTWSHYPPDFDYWAIPELPVGETPVTVLPTFDWPYTGDADVHGLTFHGAMLNQSMDALFGSIGSFTFGYGPA